MIRSVIVSVAVIAACAATPRAPGGTTSTDSRPQGAVPASSLERLTMPADRLPAGCALAPVAPVAPRSETLANGQVTVVASLPVTQQPLDR